MRLVNVEEINKHDEIYSLVKQPMYVYHSVEEFKNNEKNAKYCVASFDELLAVMRKENINLQGGSYSTRIDYFRDLRNLDIWIKTVDNFVPDYADYGGKIYYLVNNKEFIPTDGCFVRLYFIMPQSNKILLYTSSGVHSISISKWEVTAAVRTQFLRERAMQDAGYNYEDNIRRLLNRKQPDANIYKFLFAFLNADAPSFLDLDKSSVIAYRHRIKKDDRYKILLSPIFRSAMVQVTKILFPELKAEARKQFPASKLIGMLATAANVAEESKDIDKILKVFHEIEEVGYAETEITNDQRTPLIPLIGNEKTKTAMLPDKPFDEQKKEKAYLDSLRSDLDSVQSMINIVDQEEGDDDDRDS